MSNDEYFLRKEISNSDLTALDKYFNPERFTYDVVKAFAEGTLIDAMITEPHKVDFYKFRVEGEDYQYSAEQFQNSVEMKRAFLRDPFCAQLLKQCSAQRVTVKENFKMNYEGFDFALNMRCKWDLFAETIDLSADIKSTTATTQKQAEEAVRHFNYDQSRALYLDLEDRGNDMIIFISKVNKKIFKVPVRRGGSIYNEGKKKYTELAFRWFYLFG